MLQYIVSHALGSAQWTWQSKSVVELQVMRIWWVYYRISCPSCHCFWWVCILSLFAKHAYWNPMTTHRLTDHLSPSLIFSLAHMNVPSTVSFLAMKRLCCVQSWASKWLRKTCSLEYQSWHERRMAQHLALSSSKPIKRQHIEFHHLMVLNLFYYYALYYTQQHECSGSTLRSLCRLFG